MNEELTYVLEENNKQEIEKIIKEESFCEKFEEKGLELHIMRMKDTGSFGVFLNKAEGTFNRNELLVMQRYLAEINREIDINGEERIGVVLDKDNDIKPFNNMDLIFHYNKTYKTQSYARMVGLSLLNEVNELNRARPDEEVIYNKIGRASCRERV